MLDHHWDAVGADYVLTETRRLVVGRHATAPATSPSTSARRASPGGACASPARPGTARCRTARDNALVKAAEVVRRLVAFRPAAATSTTCGRRRRSPRSTCPTSWPRPPDRPGTHRRRARVAADRRTPGVAHACTHTTISPNVVHGGQKTNTIPDVVDIEVDIRTVPGDTEDVVDGYLAEALGELADQVEISVLQHVRVDPLADRQPAVGRARARAPRSPTRAPSSSPG